jgi:hypothetical protein
MFDSLLETMRPLCDRWCCSRSSRHTSVTHRRATRRRSSDRRVRKLVLSALARRPEVALNPERLLVDDLLTLLEG